MYLSVRFVAAAEYFALASSAFAQTCEVIGNVLASTRGEICGVATSVHGGESPANQLTIIGTRAVAFALCAKTPDAEDFMLTLLNRWMTDCGVCIWLRPRHVCSVRHASSAATNRQAGSGLINKLSGLSAR